MKNNSLAIQKSTCEYFFDAKHTNTSEISAMTYGMNTNDTW